MRRLLCLIRNVCACSIFLYSPGTPLNRACTSPERVGPYNLGAQNRRENQGKIDSVYWNTESTSNPRYRDAGDHLGVLAWQAPEFGFFSSPQKAQPKRPSEASNASAFCCACGTIKTSHATGTESDYMVYEDDAYFFNGG